MSWDIIRLSIVDSTQTWARRLAEIGKGAGTVIVAEAQTAGKGRQDRTWSSLQGGLYLTAVMEPHPQVGLMPLLASVAVSEVIMDRTGLKPSLKWPNDVLVDGRKVAGILIDSVWQGSSPVYILVGIGVNLNNPLPDSIIAGTSISKLSGEEVDIDTFLHHLLERMTILVNHLDTDPGEVINRWRELSVTIGQEITLRVESGAILRGVAVDIDSDGALLLEDGESVRKVLSGTILGGNVKSSGCMPTI
jgi:BirA family biotin operon repressor/biotin-[acetyl-CoA-carboxylase] ligase